MTTSKSLYNSYNFVMIQYVTITFIVRNKLLIFATLLHIIRWFLNVTWVIDPKRRFNPQPSHFQINEIRKTIPLTTSLEQISCQNSNTNKTNRIL